MNSYYNVSNFDFPFLTPRTGRRLKKYAIILNEPKAEPSNEIKEIPCPLAAELLPDLLDLEGTEDLVSVIGEILDSKIKAHAIVDKVAFLKPDQIIGQNHPTLVPVMYRIASEEFATSDCSTFKIIECRNATKLISDWKPSLPDKLISLGHQVVVVQLETSFVPYNDFAYAILRQLDFDWKNRLPRSFFFPDDVCKVEETPERDLCVVSPSMPDGDLEINKKMGLLNYELLMMIKSSCMSAMKNYLIKRDLRVGKFSDTLDGVSALRQLYRKLQDRLKRGEALELRSSALDDLKKLVKQSIAATGTDALAAQTWIEYGKSMGLDIPLSKSSSTTSISADVSSVTSKQSIMGEDKVDGDDDDDEEKEQENGDDTPRLSLTLPLSVNTSSSGFDKDDGKDCQRDASFLTNGEEGGSGTKRQGGNANNDTTPLLSTQQHRPQVWDDSQEDEESESDSDEDGFKLEDFVEFKDSLEKLQNSRRKDRADSGHGDDGEDYDDEDYSVEDFSAESIIKILKVPDTPVVSVPEE